MNTVACLPPADTTDIDMEAGPSTELAELARLKAELQAEAGSLASLAAEMVSGAGTAGSGPAVVPEPGSSGVSAAATGVVFMAGDNGLSYSQLLHSVGNSRLDLGHTHGNTGSVLPHTRTAVSPDAATAGESPPPGPADVLPRESPGRGHGTGTGIETAHSEAGLATLAQMRDITALKDKVIARLGDKLRERNSSVGEVVDALKRNLEAERTAHQHSKLELRDVLQQLHAAIRTSNAAQAELKQEKGLYRETLQTINARCEQREKYYVGLEKRCEALTAQEQTRSALANAQVKALADQKAKNKALTHSLGLQKEENVLQLQQMRFYETSVQQFTPADLAGSGASYPSSASGWQR